MKIQSLISMARENRVWSLLTALVLIVAVVISQVSVLAAGAVGSALLMGAIIDSQQMFSDSQNLTATGASTNIIDTASVPQNFIGTFTAERRIGTGEPLVFVIHVLAIDAASADETYTATFQTDDNSGFSSATQLGEIVTIPRASAIGTKFIRTIPAGLATERFLRINYTLGGTTPSLTIDAYITLASMVQNEQVYPKNFLVSI
jgi:hypothetical protein